VNYVEMVDISSTNSTTQANANEFHVFKKLLT